MLGQAKRIVKTMFRTLGMDVHLITQAEKRRYEWLKAQDIKTVIDIGANTGQFAIMIREILNGSMIYAFEPLASCYKELSLRMSKDGNFKAFNFALGDTESTSKIHRNEYAPSSSLLKMNRMHKDAFPYTENEVEETIEVRCLDKVADELLLENNILIKIDVQGYESKVIDGGCATISKAKIVIIETSFEELYDDQPLFGKIYETMREMNFSFHGNLDQLMSPIDGSIIQADSIFIRNN
jgi:FkbM family methyltransferase